MRGTHVKILALILVSIGLSLAWFKTTQLGLPLIPTEKSEVWTVEARIQFKARHNVPVKVQFHIPRQPEGYTVVDESFVSGNYGLTTEDDGSQRSVQWAVRKIRGYQALYYRIQLSRDPTAIPATGVTETPSPENRAPIILPDALRFAATGLIEEIREKSADSRSYAKALLQRLNEPTSDANIMLLRQGMEDSDNWVKRIIDLLNLAEIPARMTQILILEDGISHGSLTPWVEVLNGEEWEPFDPNTGEAGRPQESVVWHIGDDPVLDVLGGRNSKVEFSISERAQDQTLIAEQRARQMGSRVMEYSLYSLPIGTQNIYRVLLMVPVGAFLIVCLRNVIGLKTFGTFMPILIAMAFRETELIRGTILFCVLTGLGLSIRFYLEYLNLLLVPRLAAVLIIVVMLMVMISIMSHKLGFDRGVSVALFPMVILAMTIERMSLVWEELGAGEALVQGFGSLLVAALGYLCMNNPYLEHLIFVFPELLLVVLAMTLLLGRYTGYRLTELWRFRAAMMD